MHPWKVVWKTDRQTPVAESNFKKWNFTKYFLRHRCDLANFLNVFKIRWTAALQNLTREIFPNLKRETKKQTYEEAVFHFPIKIFLRHNTYTVKYCVSNLSVLDQGRIQNLVTNLRWSFLQKLFTALGR